MEKILLASDIHQTIVWHNNVDESENFAHLLEVIRKEKIDLVLLAGDFQDVDENNMKELENISKEKKIEIFFVLGNHDRKKSFYSTFENFNGSKMLLPDSEYVMPDGKELRIAGIHGLTVEQKSDKPNRYTEKEQTKNAEMIKASLGGKQLDILLMHEFPFVNSIPSDEFYLERSNKFLQPIISILKPKIIVSGHLHGYSTIYFASINGKNKSLVINLSAFTDGFYTILTISDKYYVKEMKWKY